MQRLERLILLMTGTILNTPFNNPLFSKGENCIAKRTLVILVVFTNLMATQRLIAVGKGFFY